MKKSDLILIILAIALVAGMILTGLLGKGKSRHGYGELKTEGVFNSRS
jgi:hypothetical protein